MRPLIRPLVALAVLLAGAGIARAEIGKLLTPAALEPLAGSGQVRVVDIRDAKPGADGRTPYEAGHIPGAVAAPYPRWRGPADNPGELPPTERLVDLVRGLGVEAATPVVIVHAGTDATDFGGAARVYWTLKSLGVSQLAILNGGMKAWQAAGLPVSTEPVATTPSGFTAAGLDPTWLATRADIERELASGEHGRLLDARPAGFFLGKLWHDAAAKPGTIAGAESFTYEQWFPKGGPAIVGPDEARRIADANGLHDAPVTVSFCNTGHWAATNWFALSELAGVPGVKLYPQSMVDWSKTSLPMDHVPGRIEWLWLSTKKWLERTFG
jgi:thiosulfate/3-mercaptopyruvate sulfurtransferase